MAKGDDARTRNLIKYGSDRSLDIYNVAQNRLGQQYGNIAGNYNNAVNQQTGDYNNAMSGYKNFADTGGFTPQGISDIRARSTNPLRSAYAGANREVDRSKALQGGYSPGYGVLKARMAREQGQGLSEANTNVNAGIAQMVNQGKLAGLGGMSSLYSATPGMASTYGNQMLSASGQMQNQDEMELRRLLGYTGEQNQLNQAPGKFKSTMGNIGSVFDTAGRLGTAIGSF